MNRLRLRLFDGFDARLDTGEPITVSSKKTQVLLAYLALTPGKAHARDRLMALLWSTRGEAQARNSLRQALVGLRKRLPSAVLAVDRDALTLDGESVDVDVTEFESWVGEGTGEALERAMSLYQGDFLAGVATRDPLGDEWIEAERSRLRRLAEGAFAKRLSQLTDQTSQSSLDRVMAVAQQLLQVNPLEEAGHRALMRAFAEQGQRNLAIQQYRICEDVLAAELGVKPATDTERLFEAIRNDAPSLRDTDHERRCVDVVSDVFDTAPAPSSKPSVAVLPFTNMSGDAEQDYFSDGITEDIITELSRFRGLHVVSRHSAFVYKHHAVNVQRIAKDLGVDFVVEGSVRRAGDRVRISVQLIDASTDTHVWAERYDRKLRDVFTVQDDIARTIVATLPGRIEQAGLERSGRKPLTDWNAYDYLLRGHTYLRRYTREANAEARRLYQQAIELDPELAQAYACLLATDNTAQCFSWQTAETLEKRLAIARHAVTLDDADSRVRLAYAFTLWFDNQFEEAEGQFRKAVELNPNDADAALWFGKFLVYQGQPEDGLAWMQKALALNPVHCDEYAMALGTALYFTRDYAQAVKAFKRMKTPNAWQRTHLAAAYGQMNRPAEARRVLAQVMARTQGACDEMTTQVAEEYSKPAVRAHLLDGLRKAGFADLAAASNA